MKVERQNLRARLVDSHGVRHFRIVFDERGISLGGNLASKNGKGTLCIIQFDPGNREVRYFGN